MFSSDATARDRLFSPMRRLLLSLPLTLVATLGAQDAGVAASVCRVFFRHPPTWELVLDSAAAAPGGCRAQLRPKDWAARLAQDDSVDLYTITVDLAEVGFDAAVGESSFEQRGGQWFVMGASGVADSAWTVTGPGWRGIYAVVSSRCYGPQGYAGLCDQPTAIVGTPRRSASIAGGPQAEEAVELLLSTLRFEP